MSTLPMVALRWIPEGKMNTERTIAKETYKRTTVYWEMKELADSCSRQTTPYKVRTQAQRGTHPVHEHAPVNVSVS